MSALDLARVVLGALLLGAGVGIHVLVLSDPESYRWSMREVLWSVVVIVTLEVLGAYTVCAGAGW